MVLEASKLTFVYSHEQTSRSHQRLETLDAKLTLQLPWILMIGDLPNKIRSNTRCDSIRTAEGSVSKCRHRGYFPPRS